MKNNVNEPPARYIRQFTRERLGNGESFVAVLEVCGFNDWLIRMFRDCRCHRVMTVRSGLYASRCAQTSLRRRVSPSTFDHLAELDTEFRLLDNSV